MRLARPLFALVVASCAALSAPAAHAAFPGENGRIAFATDRDFAPSAAGPNNCGQADPPRDFDCGFEIYTMNPDGSGLQRLTDNAWKDDKPAWSPDGTRIAFESRRDCNDFPDEPCESEIYVMNADGTGVRRVTRNAASDTHPTWSPDGTKLAFESDRPVPGEDCPIPSEFGFECDRIYTISADAVEATDATLVSAGPSDLLPAWSPDGTKLAYVKFEFGFIGESLPPDSISAGAEIYTRNSDGSGSENAVTTTLPCNIDFDGLTPPEVPAGCMFNLNPTWSPDGAQIAFHRATSRGTPSSVRETDCQPFFEGPICADNQVFRIGADGTNEVQLTSNPASCGGEDEPLCPSNAKPAWSPDGSRIAFHSDRDAPGGPCGGNPDCDFEILTMNASDGGAVQALTANSTSVDDRVIDRNPDWQRVLIPPTSAAAIPACSTSGAITVTVTDQPYGSGAKAVHFRLDGGPEQTVPTTGQPGTATIVVPEGRHSLEYWGEDNQGLQETPHKTAAVVVDRTAPTLSIASNQRRRTYISGQFASVRIAAFDAVGLGSDPSTQSRRLSTARLGNNAITVVATDECGNQMVRTFRYVVRPRLAITGVRRSGCAPRIVRARFSVRGTARRRVQVFLDGRRLRTTTRSTFTVAVPTRNLRRGPHALRITVTDPQGRRTSRTVRFFVCAARPRPRFTG